MEEEGEEEAAWAPSFSHLLVSRGPVEMHD